MNSALIVYFFALFAVFCVNADDCCDCPAQLNCSSGWEPFNGHCYTFVETKSNWDQANTACLYLGGHLLKSGSEYENKWIVGKIKEQNLSMPWIGFKKVNNRWQWTDGSSLLYTDWNKGEPSGDGNCGQIRDDLEFHWNDEPCDRQYGYICEQD